MRPTSAEAGHAGRLSLMGEMSASSGRAPTSRCTPRNYAQGSIRRLRQDPRFRPRGPRRRGADAERSQRPRRAEILRHAQFRDYVNKSAPMAPIAVGDVLQDAAIISSMEPAPSRAKRSDLTSPPTFLLCRATRSRSSRSS